MVFVIEGLPYFAFPDKVKAYLLKLQEMPDSTLRLLGLSAVIVGLIFVFLGRS
jgi:hypothetical protein